MRYLGTICTLALLATTTPAMAETASPPEIGKQIETFFSMLRKGDSANAVGGVIDSSPLWRARTGGKEQMVAQIDAAVKIYGPVVTYECLPSDELGTMILRQYCLAQHKDIVTRWEFDFMKASTGWTIGYFGFNDQIQSWF